jgi:hypothetical protein
MLALVSLAYVSLNFGVSIWLHRRSHNRSSAPLVVAAMAFTALWLLFVAFRAWDPALHDPPAATWPKQHVGDMAYLAIIMTSVWWSIS